MNISRSKQKSKTFISFILIVTFMITSSCQSDVEKLEESKIDQQQKELAHNMADRILKSMKNGEYNPLGSEATITMQQGLTPEKQKIAYENIKGLYGDYQSLIYKESWIPTNGLLLTIYRFEGQFESKAKPEVRVVLDGDNKLSGFWIKEWQAELK